ncbi:MAG TPA: hypothetical protein VGD55_13665 [Acidothermaceae bacterium]
MSVADTLEQGGEPHPALPAVRRAAYTLGVIGVVVFVTVQVLHSIDRREQRASFDRMLSLSAGAQAAVEQAVSQERDTAQYAEPLLNSSLTTQAVREHLYVAVSASALQAQRDIDAQVQRIQADSTGRSGRLRSARDAMLAYLASWSALFASAAGSSNAPADSQTDLDAQQVAARTALEKAAPDPVRAAKARVVFGTTTA